MTEPVGATSASSISVEAPVLGLHGVGLTINGVTILENVTFEVNNREFIGLIGPNGAGKTSLINVISGLTPPTAGRVELLANTVTSWSPHRRARVGLGRTFQTSNLYNQLTVEDNVRLALQARTPEIWRGLRVSVDEDRLASALERVGLIARRGERAAALSHGDRRKLEMAMAIASESRLLLLDEPMAGVSIGDVDDLVEVIREIHHSGVTVVMVEHHLEVVLGLSDRLAVMHHGALLAIDVPDVVIADPTVQAAYVGDAL